MIILSNCLMGCLDEGCIKVAENLIRRIKAASDNVTVVTYEYESALSDYHWPINKFLLNTRLIRLITRKKEPVLYIPHTTRMLPMAVRTFILSQFARDGLDVVLAMRGNMDRLTRWLLKRSRANLIALSQPSQLAYQEIIGDRAKYLLAGVDASKFLPADAGKKHQLRKKYGIPEDKTVVLHVGHMKVGRNIGHLLSLDDDMHAMLVVSAIGVDSNEDDLALYRKLKEKSNITIIDDYIENVEEIYQLSDVYLFPVVHAGNCIDIPLSVMEAAACNLPVVTTSYGEMQQFIGREGFYELRSFEPKRLNALIRTAKQAGQGGRESVLDYDWDNAVQQLLSGRL